MQGVHEAHLNAAIKALLKANYDIKHSSVGDALRKIFVYGDRKGTIDTLGLDSGPEITICRELRNYEPDAVIITEEIGSEGMHPNFLSRSSDPKSSTTVFICDPTDRSTPLKNFLSGFPHEMEIGDIFNNPDSKAIWERDYGAPMSITGATSAITCVRRGYPIFSVVVNYLTQELVVSCAAGNKVIKLPDDRPESLELHHVLTQGKTLHFPKIDGRTKIMKNFVTFMGDEKKTGYKENMTECGLMSKEQIDKHLRYGNPGGPSRALYLSSLQIPEDSSGFVFANGEKIGEWIHWLPFLRFAKDSNDNSQPALVLFEVFQDQPKMKEGILMSTPPNYSIFQTFEHNLYVDINNLLRMSNPSKFRSMLILAPYDNRWVASTSKQSGFREIVFPS